MHVVDERGDTFEVLSSGTYREVDERAPVGEVRRATKREVLEFERHRVEAWAKIVETLPFVAKMLQNVGLSDDLAVPAIAKAWRAYDPDRGSWYSLVRSVLWHDIMHASRRARIKEQPLEDWIEKGVDGEREVPDVIYILDRLSERDRSLILLRFWAGMKLDEIGSVMGFSKAGAWLCVKRAIEKAREIYDEEQRGNVPK